MILLGIFITFVVFIGTRYLLDAKSEKEKRLNIPGYTGMRGM